MQPDTQSSETKPTDSTTISWWHRLWRQKPHHLSSVNDAIAIEPREYLERRAVYKIESYTKAAKREKSWYLGTSPIAIIGSATVPVLIKLEQRQVLGFDHIEY